MAIIAINRYYGSGGRVIGQNVAKKLGIPFYDKELLSIAARDSGFTEALFENADERPSNSLLYSIVTGNYNSRSLFFGGSDVLTNDTLFNIQAEVIRKVSANPCVIVGRCADFILRERKDLLRVFITAPLEKRMAFLVEDSPELKTDRERENYLRRMDKSRRNYYNYYTNRTWDELDNYDLTINTGLIDDDASVDLIIKALELAGLK